MTNGLEDVAINFNQMADYVLQLLWQGYEEYVVSFDALTQKAAGYFERRDWTGLHMDTVQRLDLYTQVVSRVCGTIISYLSIHAQNPKLWLAIKSRFAENLALRHDAELACTFYNSINRRILQTVGIEPAMEFVEPRFDVNRSTSHAPLTFVIETPQLTDQIIETILTSYNLRAPHAVLKTDARLCAERISLLLKSQRAGHGTLRIEMVKSPFYREMGAYLIGRLTYGAKQMPLVFALIHGEDGVTVDALLLRTEEVRILFSFSHTYFHVQTDCPRDLVQFLREVMPSKRVAELYISLGYNKHGKTELYRDLLTHQRVCSLDLFDFADGQRGMVMIAFNMPQDHLIYKVIRDRFATPKHATRQQVMEKYDYVFKHNRAGRLVDVQSFENLEIENCCFTPELLAEIQSEAQRTATIENDRVVLHHVYVERRLIPLDVYLQRADAEAAKAAVIDYGQAIKDLAHINVFPGDMLIKNFGVTQLGRVVFYDYDELCPLTVCNFRRMPQSRAYEDELSAEPWFMVGENDVFPEEFAAFLALAPDLRRIFMKHHGELLTPEFWQHTQDQIRAGVLTPILPYSDAQRLRPGKR
ncbi:MAG: bifunctional isocitrate dehydrogenase kinase/phosphatase [Desulfobacteraceae bacterium]|nr:bifunctional isocitrate dehydrogenase kinase/phosphatase [Desulfobacteraceae bacterium]